MAAKILNVPYFSQLDNERNPFGSCNVTSCAMVMAFYGLVGNGQGQFEDQLYSECLRKGLDRHSPWDLRELFGPRGLKDDFTMRANWQQVREAIDQGKPCIVHGYFTRSGHIIVIVGYDDDAYGGRGAWVVNDPYGEWFADGYATERSGKQLRYSKDMMNRTCQSDGELWIHTISKS